MANLPFMTLFLHWVVAPQATSERDGIRHAFRTRKTRVRSAARARSCASRPSRLVSRHLCRGNRVQHPWRRIIWNSSGRSPSSRPRSRSSPSSRRPPDPAPSTPRSTRCASASASMRRETYAHLDAWQKTQIARHPQRPHFVDYVGGLIEEFVELRGDRKFADDQAIMGGLGRFRGQPVVVIGQEKGHDTTTRIKHNFGMAPARGLPQGGAPDGPGRAVRPAGAVVRRHRRRLSGHRSARSAASPRRSPARTERCLTLVDADDRGDHRRRRLAAARSASPRPTGC